MSGESEEWRRLSVPLGGGRSYPVVVGDGAIDTLRGLIAEVTPNAKRVVIVTDAGLRGWVDELDTGGPTTTHEIGLGEKHKTLATVEALCRAWSQEGVTRNDVIVAVGGGLVTDVAGFGAAMYHRGTSVIHISTTLLGMIDAAIGGKTGVNLPEGKNLVGSFWQPSAVICDTATLRTLPLRELRSGTGELLKYVFLEPTLAQHVDCTPMLSERDRTIRIDELPLVERIARCIELKAAVVAADEREGGLRALLNYGHTLAHAIEIAGDHGLRHGEAVAIGLVFAAELAHILGRVDADRVQEHRSVIKAFDLADVVPPGINQNELLLLMGRDKKALDGLTFVLDGPAGIEVCSGLPVGPVRDALRLVGAGSP